MKIFPNKNNMMQLDQGKLELFVYEKYIGGGMGVISGDTIETFGLLPYRYYKKISDTKPSEVGTLDLPSMIKFYPTTAEYDKTVKVYPVSEEKKYTIMTFEAGSDMWPQYNLQALMNAQIYLTALLSGKLDNNIPYPMLLPSWIKNQRINKFPLSIPVSVMGMIIHTMCIDKKSGRPFGEILGKDPKHSLIGYDFLNVRKASRTSVFGGLSFEDQNASLDAAISMTNQNKEQKISPLEKMIKY